MDSNTFMGLLVFALIALCGIAWKYKDELKKDNKPIQDLNRSVIELTFTLKQLNQDTVNLKSRVDTHGTEIHALQRECVDHKARIINLEKHCDDLLEG